MPPGKQEQVAPPGFDGYGPYPPQGQLAGYPPQQPYPPQQGYGQAAYGQPAYGQPAAPGQQWAAPAAVANGGQQRPNNNTIGAGSYVVNVDPDMEVAQQFATTQMRNGFVRKVFGIVSVQLLFTVGIACLFLFNNELKTYVRRNNWVFWLAWALAIGLLLVISCVEKARRSFPTNLILLGAFTAVQAFLVGTLTAFYNIEAVAIAFAVTSAAVIAITIFAINTKIDVTKWGTLLLVALVAFIVLLIIGMFWVNKILWLVLSGVACLIFSAYLLYDIQLVMGGRYYSISPDEYIFAALNIYLDIINMFIWMLSLIGLASSSN